MLNPIIKKMSSILFSKESELLDEEEMEADIIESSSKTAEKEPVPEIEIIKEDVHD